MTYKDQFVVEVKCKGKFLRVINDNVRLPFGSEYSLYLKNLDSRRASVNISIDGEDVLNGQSLILNGNSSTELEGFLKGNVATNRFRFINKTKEIQDYRGDRGDDGIVRVEFAFEKSKPITIHETHYHYHNDPFHWNYDNWFNGNSSAKYGNSNDSLRGMSATFSSEKSSDEPVACFASCSNISCDSLGVESVSQPLADEGITVKGSECNQQFQYTSIGALEESKVIVIRLKGLTKSHPVQKIIAVETKLTCSTCGRTSKSSFKYCPNCGTYLE